MSFTGDLEHLPIVDVIQLMNTSRKSGILSVKGKKGESQLVFKDGYIVSASHLNNSIRIGQILIDTGFITQAILEQALQKQQQDGSDRKPLVITMIEMGVIKEEDAYKGLQKLIEITLVEILTWKSGKFTLEALTHSIDCEFRYYPEKMNHEVNLNTQSILMDALRIFDEKMRDGLLEEEPPPDQAIDDAFNELLSEDDLGLAEIDQISTQLPKAFTGLAPFDPVSTQRGKIQELAPNLTANDLDKLTIFLAGYTKDPEGMNLSVEKKAQLLLINSDPLLIHSMETVCADSPLKITAVSSEQALAEALATTTAQAIRPFLVFDLPAPKETGNGMERAAAIRDQIIRKHPGMISIQLAPTGEPAFYLGAYKSGVKAAIPRVFPEPNDSSFADSFIALLEILPSYILNC